jgi:hypothetical protein
MSICANHRRRINTEMNSSPAIMSDHAPERRWIVKFKGFRTRDEAQRRVIEELGQMAYEVVRLWLNVVTSGAVIVGPSDQSVRRISFRCRSKMRGFLRTFGGRQIRPANGNERP